MQVSLDPELDEVVRASDRPTYNTAAVEQRTGLRPATFRAWERRYGFPKPNRLPGNQRLYSDQDVAAIRWLQRRTDEGLSISHAIRLLQDRLSERQTAASTMVVGRPPAEMARDLVGALLAFDSTAAMSVLAEAFAMYRVEDVCLEVVQPALVVVGERWEHGEISVAVEHFASNFIRRQLFALFNVYETGHGRGRIFAGCAPDERHEIGLLMLSLFLARRGFRMTYLGTGLVAVGLGETLHRYRPDLLVISASREDTARGYEEIAAVVNTLPEPRPMLGYGGHGFDDPAYRACLPGLYLGLDGRTAADVVEGLMIGSYDRGRA
ncbi:MAG: B12-binding domain-containing protein [Chloroflexi bacterium]|nr:B12-binding domain-containing protein [Chloroflexota bacterium]